MNQTRHRRRINQGRAAAAIAVTAVVLAGCSTGSGGPQQGTGQIHVAANAAPSHDQCMKTVVDDFKKNTGIDVVVDSIPYSALRDKYLSGFAAGAGDYDLVDIAFQWTGEFADAGFLEPIDKGELSGLLPSAVDQYSYKGKQYAVPLQSGIMGMFYRTDVLQKLGAEYPKNWDEAEKLAATITADPSLKGMKPFALMGDRSQGMANFNSIYRGLGGKPLENENAEPNPLDVSTAARTLDLIRTNLKEYSPSGALAAGFADTPPLFASGQVAFLPAFDASPGNLFEQDSSTNAVKGKYSFAPLPGGAGDLGGFGLAIPTDSKNKENAKKFAEYMASPEVDVKCAANNGRGPVRETTFSDKSAIAANPVLPQLKTALEAGVKRYTGAKGGTLNDLVDTYTNRYVAGDFPSAQAAAEQLAAEIAKVK